MGEARQDVLLLVDDNPTNLQVLFKTLAGGNYKLLVAQNGETALAIAQKAVPDLILLDIMMPGIDGYETCKRLKDDPATAEIPVIFLSALDDTDAKVRGFERGAVDYVAKPFQAPEVVARVEAHLTIGRLHREVLARNEALQHELEVAKELVDDAAARLEGPLLGTSDAVKALRESISACARAGGTVLLKGPPGAGQEAVARQIHHESPRGRRAFLYVNCMALGAEEAKATLFGAGGKILGIGTERRPGKWDLAAGGTLFLDRVGQLEDAAQKVLAQKLGSDDVRVIASTPQDLAELEHRGRFRRELLAAVTETTVDVPALTERLADIPALVEQLIGARAGRLGKAVEKCSRSALKRLVRYRWPGNLEELSSVIECAVIASTGSELEIDDALLSGGERIGRYRLLERLGKGGMGEVWRAEHELLRRPAAVKLILASEGADRKQISGQTLKRFEREARATAALQSPNTVRLYDYGISDSGDLYYVMELMRGVDLDQMLRDHGPMDPGRLIWFLRAACRSLGEAHAAGLVHRDIKPANLFAARLGPEYDFLKVLDFGIVKGMDEPQDLSLTGGGLVGSPAFVPPEVVMGDPEVDGRADLYSLGCVAYVLLTGQQVFGATTVAAMCVAHASHQPKSFSEVCRHPIPADLEQLVMSCLAKRAEDRPADADALWRALGALDVEPWTPEKAEHWWRENLPDLCG